MLITNLPKYLLLTYRVGILWDVHPHQLEFQFPRSFFLLNWQISSSILSLANSNNSISAMYIHTYTYVQNENYLMYSVMSASFIDYITMFQNRWSSSWQSPKKIQLLRLRHARPQACTCTSHSIHYIRKQCIRLLSLYLCIRGNFWWHSLGCSGGISSSPSSP